MPLPGRGAHFPSHLMLGGVRTPLLEDTPQRLHNRVVRPPEMSACCRPGVFGTRHVRFKWSGAVRGARLREERSAWPLFRGHGSTALL